jgi:hypothetical protein
MTILRDLTQLAANGNGILGTPLAGVTAAELPTGFTIPGLLNNDVAAGDPAGTLYRFELRDQFTPAGLTFTAEENGAFSASGADGTYTSTAYTYKNNVRDTGPVAIVIGAGGTLTAVGRAFPQSYAILSDLPTIPASRTVNFGGGTNRVNFDGGTNRVDF